MGQNRGNVKEEVSVQGITQSHQIGRQNACDDGGFQAGLHKHQGFVISQGACKGLALKRGVPSLGGGGGTYRWWGDDSAGHNVEGKRVVLRLILYEEQTAGDEQRGELGSSNLKESCFPGKVVRPWIMEKIRGDEEGGRDVFGQRHGEGEGKGSTRGVREGKVRN
jgi:hypothetical protein